jgi:hypothetical protein
MKKELAHRIYKCIQNKSIKLDLRHINLTGKEIEFSILKEITQQISLYLDFNKITDTLFLAGLAKIISLQLPHNQISDVSSLNNLNNLYHLDLGNNHISHISLHFLNNLPSLKELSLEGNPICNIPEEIFGKWGNVLPQVRHYLEDLEKGKQKNNEVKVVFIGNGSVGKTQIAKRLAEKEHFVFDSQHNSTHAITLVEAVRKVLT